MKNENIVVKNEIVRHEFSHLSIISFLFIDSTTGISFVLRR